MRWLRFPLLLVCLAAFAAVSEAANPVARLVGNPADRLVSVALEDYSYDHASGCKPGPSRGAVAMQAWLERYVRGTPLGIVRCEKLSGDDFSLHAEGRAIDWRLDVSNRRERRAGYRLIALLLATDRAGTPHALARRMGIQEIIWDCKAWYSGMAALGRYGACQPGRRVSKTIAHRDHMHIGLHWGGARRRTSFWRYS